MEDTNLAGLVDYLRRHPADDVARFALADLLDDMEPSPVDLHELPNWLRLCWLRLVPKPRGRGHWRPTDRHSVAQEIQGFLGGFKRLDHWGTAGIANLYCFVSEPYQDIVKAPDLFRPLARALPCCAHGFARYGHWNQSTVRAILFPPLEMPPSKRKRKAANHKGINP